MKRLINRESVCWREEAGSGSSFSRGISGHELLHCHRPVRSHSSLYPEPMTPLALLRDTKAPSMMGCVSHRNQSLLDCCTGVEERQTHQKDFLSETSFLLTDRSLSC